MHLVLAAAATLLVIQYASAKEEARFSMQVTGKLKYHKGAGAFDACTQIVKLELLDKDGWHDEQACGATQGRDAEITEADLKLADADFKFKGTEGEFHLRGVAWDPFDDEALLEPVLRVVLKPGHTCVHGKLKDSALHGKDDLWTNKNVLRIAAPRKYSQFFTDWKEPNKSFKESADQTFKDAAVTAKVPNWGKYTAKWIKEGTPRKHATFNFGDINVNMIEFMNCPGTGCFLRKTQKCGFAKASTDWEADVVKDNNGEIAWPGSATLTPDKEPPKFEPHEA